MGASSEPGGAGSDQVTAQAAAGEAAGLALVVLEQGRLVAAFSLPASGRVVLGRGTEAALVVPHASVSRRHAELELRPRTVVVRDLGSANGTRFRGHRVSPGEALELGPGDGFELGELVAVVQREARRELADVAAHVVVDPVMQELHRVVARVADSDLSVLLLGETGVGKEVFAECIHRASRRHQGPLLRVNCAALSESILESELFGHEKGAFTGAHARRAGIFESAAGGSVFLDEIGEIGPGVQAKLLRVLEHREVTRMGGVESVRVDVRFVSATNRALAEEAEAGRFRRDLYYRLAGLSLQIPPLRERRAEIVPLAERFLREAQREHGRPARPLSAEAREHLRAYDWPGNIRELRQAIGRAVLLADGPEIGAAALQLDGPPARGSSSGGSAPGGVARGGPSGGAPPLAPGAGAPPLPTDDEHAALLAALEACAGNQTRAAKLLGISRTTLVMRLERYGVPRPRK